MNNEPNLGENNTPETPSTIPTPTTESTTETVPPTTEEVAVVDPYPVNPPEQQVTIYQPETSLPPQPNFVEPSQPINSQNPQPYPQEMYGGGNQPPNQPPIYGYPSAYPNQQPPKKPFPVVPVLATVAAILVVILVIVISTTFLGSGKLKKNPEKTALQSLQNTYQNLKSTPSTLPRYNPKNPNQPRKSKIDISFANMGNRYSSVPMNLGQIRFQGESRTDYVSKQAYVEASLDLPMYSFKPTSVYITPQKVLFSAPNLYSAHEYASINLETFPDQWNKSSYGKTNSISSSTNIPNTVENTFRYLESTQKSLATIKPPESVLDRVLKDPDQGKNHMQAEYLSKEDGLLVFRVTLTPTDYDWWKNIVADELENTNFETQKQLLDSFPIDLLEMLDVDYNDLLEEYMESTEEIADAIRETSIDDNMIIDVSVHAKTVEIQKLELHPVDLETDVDYFRLSGTVTLGSGKYLLHDLAADITIMDVDYDETIHLLLTHNVPEDKKLIGDRWDLTVETKDEYDKESITFYSDFSWDKSTKEEHNMSYKVGAKSGSERLSINLRGNLKNDGEAIIFSDGRLSFMQGNIEVLAFLVDCSVESISSKEVAPKTKDTIDFFDVNWEKEAEKFQEDFEKKMNW